MLFSAQLDNKFHQPWDLLLTKGGNYCLFFEPMGVILCFLKMKTFLTKHFKTSIIIHVQMVLQSSIIHVQMVLHGIGFWFTRISNFVNSCKIHWNRELAALYHEFKISQLYLYIYIYIYTQHKYILSSLKVILMVQIWLVGKKRSTYITGWIMQLVIHFSMCGCKKHFFLSDKKLESKLY